jgi:N-acetylglucosaminyl-diphospho-decaprenol L-rhamnosyltransferase
MSVLVVIVNYRTGRLVVDCLRSLEPELRQHPATRVTVVENASGDDSAEVIRAAIEQHGWGSWVELLISPVNGGFAAGNNCAIRHAIQSGAAAPDFYWLLNPDTQVRPGALRAMRDFMGSHPRAGIAGGMLEEGDGALWPYAFRFPSLVGEIERGFRLGVVSRLLKNWAVVRRMPNQPTEVDWLPGASMMIRREVFDAVGLMDESYFLYFEETDFCLQARRAQWQCWYVPESRVMHIAGQSTGVTDKRRPPRPLPKYWFDSRRRYFVKNHGRVYAVCADVAWVLSFLTWRVRRLLQRKPDPDPPHLLADFIRNSAILNACVSSDDAGSPASSRS